MTRLCLLFTRSRQCEQFRAKQKALERLSKTTKQSHHNNTEKWRHLQRHHDEVRRSHEHNSRRCHRMQRQSINC